MLKKLFFLHCPLLEAKLPGSYLILISPQRAAQMINALSVVTDI